MAITSKTSGSLTNTPIVMVSSINPISRLVKGISVVNLDVIEHTLHLEVGATILKIILNAGDNLNYGTTVALGSSDLVGYVDEAIDTNNLSFLCSYLDEAESV